MQILPSFLLFSTILALVLFIPLIIILYFFSIRKMFFVHLRDRRIINTKLLAFYIVLFRLAINCNFFFNQIYSADTAVGKFSSSRDVI